MRRVRKYPHLDAVPCSQWPRPRRPPLAYWDTRLVGFRKSIPTPAAFHLHTHSVYLSLPAAQPWVLCRDYVRISVCVSSECVCCRVYGKARPQAIAFARINQPLPNLTPICVPGYVPNRYCALCQLPAPPLRLPESSYLLTLSRTKGKQITRCAHPGTLPYSAGIARDMLVGHAVAIRFPVLLPHTSGEFLLYKNAL